MSPSARKAWIEITECVSVGGSQNVAFRTEGVD